MRQEGVFEWHRVRRPPPDAARRTQMYKKEIEERAALLRRLGYDRARARTRLLANIEWDFEIGAGPKLLQPADVDAILEQIWSRGGPASGGSPSV